MLRFPTRAGSFLSFSIASRRAWAAWRYAALPSAESGADATAAMSLVLMQWYTDSWVLLVVLTDWYLTD